jgi:UDP-N-acetyl-D-mannosaminuronic acid transferase (WecB/TagA/CpsF family)
MRSIIRYKAGSLHLSSSKSMLIESTLASAFGLVSTACNFAVLAAEHGHQAAQVCLAACLTDVVVSAVVFYYVTRHASHERTQTNGTAEVVGHTTTVPVFLTGGPEEVLSKSETRLSEKPAKSPRFPIFIHRHQETFSPETTATEVDVKIP